MGKEKRPSFFKRKLVVYPKFQYSLVAFFIGCTLINSLVFFVAINGFFANVKSNLIAAHLSPLNPIFQFLSTQQYMLNAVLTVVTVFGIVGTFWCGLWLSNKVAGPIYRVLKVLKDCDEKNDYSSVIHFRNGDYLFEVQNGLNDHLKAIKGIIESRDLH